MLRKAALMSISTTIDGQRPSNFRSPPEEERSRSSDFFCKRIEMDESVID